MVLFAIFCSLILLREYLGAYFKISSPISFTDIGLIFCSYAFSPFSGIIVVSFSYISKLFFGRFKPEHITKFVLMIASCFFVYFFRNWDIVSLSLIVLLSRYLLEYLIDIILLGKLAFSRPLQRVVRTLSTVVIILYLGQFILGMMV